MILLWRQRYKVRITRLMIFLAELCSFIFHCITNCFLHFIWSFHDDELYSASKGVIDTSIGDNHSINGSNSF